MLFQCDTQQETQGASWTGAAIRQQQPSASQGTAGRTQQLRRNIPGQRVSSLNGTGQMEASPHDSPDRFFTYTCT